MDISRRDLFKELLSKESLPLLFILLPGGFERLLGIAKNDSPSSAEEAGFTLRSRPNRSIKLLDGANPTSSSKNTPKT